LAHCSQALAVLTLVLNALACEWYGNLKSTRLHAKY
jgi:hypothetical protein